MAGWFELLRVAFCSFSLYCNDLSLRGQLTYQAPRIKHGIISELVRSTKGENIKDFEPRLLVKKKINTEIILCESLHK